MSLLQHVVLGFTKHSMGDCWGMDRGCSNWFTPLLFVSAVEAGGGHSCSFLSMLRILTLSLQELYTNLFLISSWLLLFSLSGRCCTFPADPLLPVNHIIGFSGSSINWAAKAVIAYFPPVLGLALNVRKSSITLKNHGSTFQHSLCHMHFFFYI